MRHATTGDTVRVQYAGTLDDGTEFDNSAKHEPIDLTIGSGQFFPGLESALVGMAEGDTKTVTLQPENAFGSRNPQFVQDFDRGSIPPEADVEIGTVLEVSNETGDLILLMVVDINDEKVTLDGNHPLAGKALTFELTLIKFVG